MRQIPIFYFKKLIHIAMYINIFITNKRGREENLIRIFSSSYIVTLYKIEMFLLN